MATISTTPVRSWQLASKGLSPRGGLLQDIRSAGYRTSAAPGLAPGVVQVLAHFAAKPASSWRQSTTSSGTALELFSNIAQNADLWDTIMREAECHRHVVEPGHRTNLRVLALRYGLAAS